MLFGAADSDAVLASQNFLRRFGDDLPDTETIPLDGKAADDEYSGISSAHSTIGGNAADITCPLRGVLGPDRYGVATSRGITAARRGDLEDGRMATAFIRAYNTIR